MEKWYKNKELTRDDVIKVQYEMLLLSMVIQEHATLMIQANITQNNFPPFKDRLDAISNYTNSFSNPYYKQTNLPKKLKLMP